MPFALCFAALCLLRYASLRYSSLRYAFLRYGYLRYASFRDGYLRYASLRYAFLRHASLRYASSLDGHLQNRLVAIQLWIDAFMIWTILFQILIIEFCHRYTSILSKCFTIMKRLTSTLSEESSSIITCLTNHNYMRNNPNM